MARPIALHSLNPCNTKPVLFGNGTHLLVAHNLLLNSEYVTSSVSKISLLLQSASFRGLQKSSASHPLGEIPPMFALPATTGRTIEILAHQRTLVVRLVARWHGDDLPERASLARVGGGRGRVGATARRPGGGRRCDQRWPRRRGSAGLARGGGGRLRRTRPWRRRLPDGAAAASDAAARLSRCTSST